MSRAVCFVMLLICVSDVRGQSIGEPCENNGAAGVCKDIMQCPSALQDLKNKIRPKTCYFAKTDPVVCCINTATSPGGTPTTTTPSTTTSTTTTTTTQWPVATTSPPKQGTSTTEYTPEYIDYVHIEREPDCAPLAPNMTALKTGQKAWDKCIEYQQQYVFPCQNSVALTGGRVRGNNCKHNANQLVINGISATEGEFPHMTLLGYGEKRSISFQCGGSIVSESFLLTAGHCTYAKGLGPVTFALVGTLRRSDQYDDENLYGVQRIHKHLEYAPPSRYNDIALLETDRRIKLGAFVVPACLDTGSQPVEEATATGWGALVNGSIADILQKVKLDKFTDEECFQRIPHNRLMKLGIDHKTQMCFGDKLVSKDTCQGDSGGPLQVNSARINCMYVVVGVTSFGYKCGVVGEPGVYTRVLNYLSWIESVVWQ